MSVLSELDLLLQDRLRSSLELENWHYRDLPRMKPEDMKKFKEIAGEENLYWITRATYSAKTTRGQVMISPEGMKRLADAVKESDDQTS